MERCCYKSSLALQVIIIGLLCSYAVPGALPNFDGGRCGEYCSYAHVKGYIGPLDTAQNLKDALDSVSYKREIILVHHAQLDYAYQVGSWTPAGGSACRQTQLEPEPRHSHHGFQLPPTWHCYKLTVTRTGRVLPCVLRSRRPQPCTRRRMPTSAARRRIPGLPQQ